MLHGKRVVITGASRGIGRALALAFAEADATVVATARQSPDLTKVVEAITSAGGRAVAIPCDVTEEGSVKHALDMAIEQNGVARVLVNCAGVGGSSRIVGKNGPMSLASFERVVKINLVGSFNMMRLVAERMIASEPTTENERGVIISTVSVAAYEGQIGQAAYAASKGGIASLTLPAAREFAQFGIRVNAIAPGLFETPLLDELSEEARKGLSSSIPFPKRLGMATEFAKLALHIIENTYINGEVIRIDGALRMQSK